MIYKGVGLDSSVICAKNGTFSTALAQLVSCTRRLRDTEPLFSFLVSAANQYCTGLVPTADPDQTVTASPTPTDEAYLSSLSAASAASAASLSSVRSYEASGLAYITACLSYLSDSQPAPTTLSCDFSKLKTVRSYMILSWQS